MPSLAPVPQQYFDNSGAPLASGLVYFYQAGTSTPKDTYTTSSGATANANPVVLNSAGRPTTGIWGTGTYKIVVKTSAGSTLETRDNVVISNETLTDTVLNETNFIKNPSFIQQLASLPAAPSDNDFVFPGWRILMENASGVVPSFVNNSIIYNTGSDGLLTFVYDRAVLTVGTGEDGKFGLFQVIENKDTATLTGTLYLSLQAALQVSGSGISNVKMAVIGWSGTLDTATSDPVSAWGVEGTNPTLAANWAYLHTPANLSVTTTMSRYKIENIASGSGTYSNFAVLIWCDDRTTTVTSDVLVVSNVKLERGAVCSEFSRSDQAVGVAQAQRQYFAVAGDAKVLGSGVSLTSTTAKVLIPLPTTMRAVPTLTVSNVAHFTVDDGTGTPVACSGITLDAASTVDMAILSITTASGLTAGRATYLKSASASATIEFKARI